MKNIGVRDLSFGCDIKIAFDNIFSWKMPSVYLYTIFDMYAFRMFSCDLLLDDGSGSGFSFGDGIDTCSGESSPELRAIASSSDSCDSSNNYRQHF